jgi:hypothetical protein
MRIPVILLFLVCFSAAIFASDSVPYGKPVQVAVKQVKGEKVRSGLRTSIYYDLGSKIGESSAVWYLDTKTNGVFDLLLIDLDGDGKLQVGADAMTGVDANTLIPYTGTVVMPYGRVVFSEFDPVKARVTCIFSKVPTLQSGDYGAVAMLNKVRNANGMGFLDIDESLSRACQAHSEYVLANGNTGMALHQEEPGRPKFTEAGRAAAGGSSIYPGVANLWRAMDGWLRTSWHSWPLVDPSAQTCGVTSANNLCMFYKGRDKSYKVQYKELHFPGPDAVGSPLAFNSGEIPNPVPGKTLASCGAPIIWRPEQLRPGQMIELWTTGKSGIVKVDGLFSSPSKPANQAEWPSNSRLNVFVPYAVMKASTTYLVKLTDNGALLREYKINTSASNGYGKIPAVRK